MKNSKLIALLTSLVMLTSTITTSAHAAGFNKTIRGGATVDWSGPTVDGTEDIVAQDTMWNYGVTMTTNYGAMVTVASGLLTMTGVGKVATTTLKTVFSGVLASYAVNNVAPTSKIVNIRMDRYYVRGANGVVYYKVFASYYQLDGTFITSKLVQEGR